METMRESWTDERLDDFRREMADFRRETKGEFVAVRREMKEEFRAVRQEMKDEFAAVRQEMKDEFRLVHGEFRALHERFDRLQQTMIQFMGGIIVALIGLIATQL